MRAKAMTAAMFLALIPAGALAQGSSATQGAAEQAKALAQCLKKAATDHKAALDSAKDAFESAKAACAAASTGQAAAACVRSAAAAHRSEAQQAGQDFRAAKKACHDANPVGQEQLKRAEALAKDAVKKVDDAVNSNSGSTGDK